MRVETTRPFEHRCAHCAERPLQRRQRQRLDKDTGESRFAGEYYSCRCYGLTLSLPAGTLNQAEPLRPT